jgi:hypothetical protein
MQMSPAWFPANTDQVRTRSNARYPQQSRSGLNQGFPGDTCGRLTRFVWCIVERNRTELALGCAVLALPGLSAVIAVGSILVRDPTDPTVVLIEVIVAFTLLPALFFGNLWLFAKWRGRTTGSG